MSENNFLKNENYLEIKGKKIFIKNSDQDFFIDEYNKNSDSSLHQFINILNVSNKIDIVGLPDFHKGYFFPIGTVLATNLENALISPEGVGFDINCGIRCLKTNLFLSDFLKNDLNKIADALNENIPTGQKLSNENLNLKDLNDILENGVSSSYFSKINIKNYSLSENRELHLKNIEENGSLKGDKKLISQKAKGKGLKSFGTLGSGNHYLEIQTVDQVFDEKIAKNYDLSKDQIIVFIHCGSRGLGHEVCNFYDKKINKKFVEFDSSLGGDYFHAMNSASNFAYSNREIISIKIKKTLDLFFDSLKIDLLYDCSHNTAKIEKIKNRNFLVMRKGSSRAMDFNYVKNSKDGSIYTYQPIPIGGSMSTASYILAAYKTEDTYFSCCHGSGRKVSRSSALKTFSYEKITEDLKDKKIIFRAQSKKGIVEEAGNCYKDIDEIVKFTEELKITKKVVKLKPLLVIKG